ncbi:class I SAM-dependent rRNA methyltransferase [Thermoclostridium stercorarium]|uniref:class I SAM-dependent rRNA methyltransferase n=1 Tax=Thermoclostridium stercorarium TaxID=1510 RepID=UPI0022491952|nr:class I SAM-dependent rRNA methyltransferase [Thermoclostridium stercorarium]UZQ84815.1 class I SAM-dependent rRNA methyltransferase [Thermoclostridium stercorarium]
MKQIRPYPKVIISKKAERSVRDGHPWIYGEEIRETEGEPQNGGLVDVFAGNAFLGTGFYNNNSKITVRLISRNANDVFDDRFWRRRVEYAIRYRKTVMPGGDFSCCRLIHGEADQMPGLTVDRYGSILSVQITCLGMELVKDTVYRALWDVLKEIGEDIAGIFERNDIALRTKEGLQEYKGWYRFDGIPLPESAVIEICENGIKYLVDVENGQKTGFFLDQKYNRAAVARIAKGKRVLDCFTHTGSFGLNAALGGAEHVTCVDISQQAIDMARENAIRNGLDGKMDFICEDVFDLLTRLAERKCKDFDFIILDPPAFTKSRNTVQAAARGYKEINLKAMKLLPRGGYLATCSCSHFMTDDLFREVLASAAKDASVSLRQIEARQQAPDHPILWNVPETGYLKFYIFQVV